MRSRKTVLPAMGQEVAGPGSRGSDRPGWRGRHFAGRAFMRMLRQEDVTRIPDFVGQRVRQVSTVVELVDGTPTRPVYRTFSVLAIKPDGLLDVARLNDQQIARMEGRYRSPRADRERSGPIVDVADRFVARGGSWEPDERLLRAIEAALLGRRVRCPRVRVVR
jgi:hypothetical protein